MTKAMKNLVPEQWQDLVGFLIAPVSWIPGMQEFLLEFVFGAPSGWLAGVYFILLLFPILLWVGAVWCTQLSIYTLPFRSGRIDFLKLLLLAWWDAALSVWTYWVGLARFFVVVIGWIFTLARLALKFVVEFIRQAVMLPFQMGGQATKSYFQPGVPWIAFLMLLGWCLLEAVIFTYVLNPTVSEVLAGITGQATPRYTMPLLFVFLLVLIAGSFACIQALADAVKAGEYKFVVQMVLVEVFVMVFEVMFLYRELVDAITPWIAQQTGEKFRPGIIFTLSLATFGWLGIRGMTWFLFGQHGAPPLQAVMARKPMVHAQGAAPVAAPAGPALWRAPIEEFKREIGWLHERGDEVLEYLTLPFLHVVAAALNFGMILVTSRPVFSIPFKSLKEVLDTREMLAPLRFQAKKAGP
jgi:hypothetical protein